MGNWRAQDVALAVILAIGFGFAGKMLTDKVMVISSKLEADQALLVLMEGTVFLLVTGATSGAELLHMFRAIMDGHEVKVRLSTFVPTFIAMAGSYILYVLLNKLAKVVA